MDSLVLLEKNEEGVALLTLNRPNAANALSVDMLKQFHAHLDELAFDEKVRVVVITGAGEKVFCAGADLKERAGMNPTEVKRTVTLIRTLMDKVEALPQPTIAAMNGGAFGGGLELALSCDIRIAKTGALYGLTETALAIIPGAGGTQRLPRLIGIGKAKELIYSAARIDADEAKQIGLVERVEEAHTLLRSAYELAGKMASNGPIALRQAKRAIQAGMQVDLATGLEIEKLAYEQTIPTKDRLEGLQAFKEKRKPNYRGE
ncbi:enoyl-CoA hydratase [Alkalihalophilus marmarensis]|uniref:enoyl-CoA hydratase n=1 Tax=Alkalihalophilus marmarensis TaxID=521377 RepID=UPI002DBE0C39|nr:enoyl-CoA hydratase [Alkalihalophilus marmarensis]MEC2072036.1 enoyl-CoA hydratase [Alkalihalophilus marmarensis]